MEEEALFFLLLFCLVCGGNFESEEGKMRGRELGGFVTFFLLSGFDGEDEKKKKKKKEGKS